MEAHARVGEVDAPESEPAHAITAIAEAAASTELKKLAWLAPVALTIEGEWAFLFADLRDALGAPYDYTGSALEALAAAGGASQTYAALLRFKAGEWAMVVQVIGPTDVAWAPWAGRYGAPESMFAISQAALTCEARGIGER